MNLAVRKNVSILQWLVMALVLLAGLVAAVQPTRSAAQPMIGKMTKCRGSHKLDEHCCTSLFATKFCETTGYRRFATNAAISDIWSIPPNPKIGRYEIRSCRHDKMENSTIFSEKTKDGLNLEALSLDDIVADIKPNAIYLIQISLGKSPPQCIETTHEDNSPKHTLTNTRSLSKDDAWPQGNVRSCNISDILNEQCCNSFRRNLCEPPPGSRFHGRYHRVGRKTAIGKIWSIARNGDTYEIRSCSYDQAYFSNEKRFHTKQKQNLDPKAVSLEDIVADMKPYGLYVVQIVPKSGANRDKYLTECIETLPEAPEPPRDLKHHIETPTLGESCSMSVTFSWRLPSKLSGWPIQFIGFLKRIQKSYESSMQMRSWTTIVSGNRFSEYTHTEDCLKSGYTYQVSVRLKVENIDAPGQPAKMEFHIPSNDPDEQANEPKDNVSNSSESDSNITISVPGKTFLAGQTAVHKSTDFSTYCTRNNSHSMLDYECCKSLCIGRQEYGQTFKVSRKAAVATVFKNILHRRDISYEVKGCWCTENLVKKLSTQNFGLFEPTVQLLKDIGIIKPFTTYIVQIVAFDASGPVQPYSVERFETLPEAPAAPMDLETDTLQRPENKCRLPSVTFSWKLPYVLSGRPVKFIGLLKDRAELHRSRSWETFVNATESPKYTHTEDCLRSGTNYHVAVRLEVADVTEPGQSAEVEFRTTTEIATLERMKTWFEVDVPEDTVYRTTAKLTLKRNIALSELDSSLNVAFLLSERGCQQDPQPQTEAFISSQEHLRLKTKTWFQVKGLECVGQYQATPLDWNPIRSNLPDYTDYILGALQCTHASYCNGPLKPGTKYALIVRIISNNGFTDMDPKTFRTESDVDVLLNVTIVIGCVLITALVMLYVLWRNQHWIFPELRTKSSNVEPSDISLRKFPDRYEYMFQSNQDVVPEQFESIDNFSNFYYNEPTRSAMANEAKNRYLNVLPYDFNRVILDTDDGERCNANDYINASFIEGYMYQRGNMTGYIATQGPMVDTCNDFWRMVLQYEIEAIVMLTQPIDHANNKCCQYYPLSNQCAVYGDIQVRCTQEMNLPFYSKKVFMVTKGHLSKPVSHYHYYDWPDHSCPVSPADLIKFAKIIRAERTSHLTPLVVHCSAGVGRTGTFIALDILLQRMQHEKKINVYETVKRLRRQRCSMVQTLDQYAFLYKCCLEYITKPNSRKQNIRSITLIAESDKTGNHTEAETSEVVDDRTAMGRLTHSLTYIKIPLQKRLNELTTIIVGGGAPAEKQEE